MVSSAYRKSHGIQTMSQTTLMQRDGLVWLIPGALCLIILLLLCADYVTSLGTDQAGVALDISDWLAQQLDRWRQPELVFTLAAYVRAVVVVALFSVLLLPFAVASIAPGITFIPRLACLLLALVLPGETIQAGALSIAGEDAAEHSVAIMRATSLAALWFFYTNMHLQESWQFTANTSIRSRLLACLLIDGPHFLRAASLIPGLAIICSLDRLDTATGIDDISLVIALLATLWLARLSAAVRFQPLPPFRRHIASEAVRVLLALIWISPVVWGGAQLIQQIEFSLHISPSRMALLAPALLAGITLGLLAQPPGWIRWVVLLPLILGLLPGMQWAESHNDLVSAIGLLHNNWYDTALIWLAQLTAIAWIVAMRWKNFSHSQQYAMAMVHTDRLKLWLMLLSRPMLPACMTGLALACYLGAQTFLSTTLFGIAAAVLLAHLSAHQQQGYTK